MSSVFVILYVTLFPFDFVSNGKSLIEAARDFSLILDQPWVLNDVPRNIVLFVPFGFGLSGLVVPRLRRAWPAPAIVTAAGIVLSATIELLQASTLLRFPSLADILANGAGSTAGWALYAGAGPRILRAAAAAQQRLQRTLTPRRRVMCALTPMIAMVLLSVGLRDATGLSTWDDSFPLVIGNERTGDRAWSGTLGAVFVADRAFSSDEVAQVLGGASPAAIDPDAAVLDLEFTGLTGTPQGLQDRGTGRPAYTGRGVGVGPTHWLESEGPVSEVTRALATAGEFTMSIEAATADPDQDGPARVVSISNDAFARNLTIGQDGPDLVVRVRSPLTGPNGRSPEFIVPNVFEDVEVHRLVLTYDGSTLRLTVDKSTNDFAIELLPDVAILMTFFPDDVGQMRFTDRGLVVLRVVYRAITLLPLAVWLGSQRTSRPSTLRWAWPVLVVLPAFIVEAVLSNAIPGYEFELGLALLGSSIALAGFVGVRIRPRPDDDTAQAAVNS